MTNPEGAEAAIPAEETATQDVTVETPDAAVEETEVDTSPETDVKEGGENPPESVEDKLERLERDNAAKQKKIDRQTAANNKSRDLYEQKVAEAERLSALIEEQKPKKEPSIDDFDTHDEYNDAVKDFIRSEAKAEAQKEFLQNQQRIREEGINQERLTMRTAQENAYLADNPMYKASANEVDSYIKTLTSMPVGTDEAVISQLYDGNVAEVIDYFGSNSGEKLDELGEISRMSPPQAAVAIYKIQQKLSVSPKTKSKSTNNPTTPVKTSRGDSKPAKSISKMSGKDALDWVNN